jgi:hypothetical protein
VLSHCQTYSGKGGDDGPTVEFEEAVDAEVVCLLVLMSNKETKIRV